MKVRNEKSWRRLWKPDLKSQAWELFNVDGVDYQVKSHFVESECSYELCISDLDRIWYEKVDDETIFNDRAKVCIILDNKHLRLTWECFKIMCWL